MNENVKIILAVAAIIIPIIGTGIALGSVIVPGQRDIREEIGELHQSVGDLRERMARLEGLFEGFTDRPGQ